ncbi:hypothetical protein ACFXTU_002339 [Salmonella enterica]
MADVQEYPADPVMELYGSVYYRHYRITRHAIDRYIERIGGDLGNMIADLENSWLFDVNKKGLKRSCCATAAKCERKGGYVLCNGRAMFLIRPAAHQHIILTTILME